MQALATVHVPYLHMTYIERERGWGRGRGSVLPLVTPPAKAGLIVTDNHHCTHN